MSAPAEFTLSALRAAYATGQTNPVEVAEEALRRAFDGRHPHVWITVLDRERLLNMARALPPQPTPALPLYGVPFAIKDNLDLADVPTTAACPAFAYTPKQSATLIARLIAAGALPIGKTNLDQFATGLNGTRSPYGAPQSVFDAEYISGGSSSGSAIAVAAGMVTFALGTDTAGSGRVPAGFNHIVGHKPTRGLLSNRGLVPACRSLDCVSIFAGSCHDAQAVLHAAQSFDAEDPYSRSASARGAFPAAFRFGILPVEQRKFFGDAEAPALYEQAIARFAAMGGTAVEFDYGPLADCAALLYAGPWVAERRWAAGPFFDTHREAIHPVVRQILAGADQFDAVAAFDGQYRLEAFRQQTRPLWDQLDFLLLPTSGTTYRIAKMLADPVQLNSNLGYYTNFVNLLDLSALAVPAGFRAGIGLPFGITLVAPAFADDALLELGARYHRELGGGIGITSAQIADQPLAIAPVMRIEIAVVGAHLSGQPLNHQLTARGGRLVRAAQTAPHYRFYALPETTPPKPGLRRVVEKLAHGIAVEIWSLEPAEFGAFVAEVPPPLVIGTLELENGSRVKGYLCEPFALEQAEDITHFGGWLAYLATKNSPL